MLSTDAPDRAVVQSRCCIFLRAWSSSNFLGRPPRERCFVPSCINHSLEVRCSVHDCTKSDWSLVQAIHDAANQHPDTRVRRCNGARLHRSPFKPMESHMGGSEKPDFSDALAV